MLAPQPGGTVDDLAAALARLPGFTTTTPTAITIDGYSGKKVTLTAPASFSSCALTQDGYRLWRLPLGGIFSFNPGQSSDFRILDVNGQRLVISSDTYPGYTTDQMRSEIQAIVDSIHVARNG
jgi:hypothetical protein